MIDPELRSVPRPRRYWWIGLALVVIAALAAVVYWYGPWSKDRSRFSQEELTELVERANVAVGYLENLQLDDAQPMLVELHRQLPNEPLGIRNLAICRYLLFFENRLDAEAVLATTDTLKQTEPDSPTAYWLQAKTLYKNNPEDVAPVIAALEDAGRLAANSPVFPYEIYNVAKDTGDEQWQGTAAEALRRAYELAPHNLFIVCDWLLVQAQE